MKRRKKTLVMSTDKTTHRPTALARANLLQAKKNTQLKYTSTRS